MFGTLRSGIVSLALSLGFAASATDPVGPAAAWPYDVVVLHNGATFQGLLLNETSQGVDFQVVRRVPGRPTVTLTTRFSMREVSKIRRLSDADRAILKEKIAELDPTGAGERQRMEGLELEAADWPGRVGSATRYASDQFVLVSGAPEEITRRAAVRLEQIYAAFGRVLPARHAVARPTSVMLAGTLDDYRGLIGPTAGPLLNPAVYDPATNRIVCGSDLRRLGEELTATRKSHAGQLAALEKYEADVRQLYKANKPDLDRFLEGVSRERKRIYAADAANGIRFDQSTHRLFALLYHESFHSYVGNFVYPPLPPEDVRAGKGTGELPRWVNEGLAQMFESAVVEGGELRIGHADIGRLGRVREMVAGKGSLVPVADLVKLGRGNFLAAHVGQQASADRVYLSAWAVTFYLTFERRIIGIVEFDRYVAAVNSGTDPATAFREWVGQDIPAFEKDLIQYLARLQPDGTLAKK